MIILRRAKGSRMLQGPIRPLNCESIWLLECGDNYASRDQRHIARKCHHGIKQARKQDLGSHLIYTPSILNHS